MPIVIAQAPTEEFRLGLEKEGRQLYEQASSTYEIPFVNGKFDHGLSKEQQKKVETYYGYKFDDPNAREFWASISVEIPHTLKMIDPENAEDLLLQSVLKKFGYLAPNLEEATNNKMAKYRFVLRNEGEEEEVKASLYDRQDAALLVLADLKMKSKPYMIALAQYLFNEVGIENDVLAYTKLRELISGDALSLTKTKKNALDMFEAAMKIEKVTLLVTVDVKKAIARNIIRKDINQRFYNATTGVTYGKTVEEVITFLLNPENADELGSTTNPHPTSVRAQLKNK